MECAGVSFQHYIKRLTTETNNKKMKQYKYRVNGKSYDVAIDEIKGKDAKVTVNGISYNVEIEGEAGEGLATISGVAAAASSETAASPAKTTASAPGGNKPAAPAAASSAPGKGTPVKAPLPGVVTDIKVAVGDAVKKGQTVVVLEAMKMQNNIGAENDGTVTSIVVNKGDSVMEGATLITVG